MRAFRPSTTGLRALYTGGSSTGLTDGQLLERFRTRALPADPAAESAFEVLVERHAAMVWGVCRRSLGRADAEDAFQATFLVLVRRAGSIRVDGRGSAGRWLYGVARKVSARLRSEARRLSPAAVDPAAGDDPAALAERRDVREAVADELDRLPPKYRRPIELCDFEGLTYEQAGASLGWPTATIKSRLARGRSRLRSRLVRRGLAPAAGLVLAEFAREARAGVPKSLIPPTLRAAALASGLIPGAVARLAEGVLRTMLMEKLKPLALLLAACATTAAVARSPEDGTPPSAERPAVAPQDGPPRSKFFERFADGVGVEIVAVGFGGEQWWRPDGTLLDAPPMDPFPQKTDGYYEVLYQLHDLGPDDYPMPGVFNGFIRDVRRGGKVVPGLRWFSFRPSRNRPSAIVGFRSLKGPWQTIQTWSPGGGGSNPTPRGGRTSHTSMVNEQGQAVATIVHEVDSEEAACRIVAVDAEGHETRGVDVTDLENETFTLLQSTFDLPVEKIQKFRLQKKARDHVDIADVAIHPRQVGSPH